MFSRLKLFLKAHINQRYTVCDRFGNGVGPELPATRQDTELKLETRLAACKTHTKKEKEITTYTDWGVFDVNRSYATRKMLHISTF